MLLLHIPFLFLLSLHYHHHAHVHAAELIADFSCGQTENFFCGSFTNNGVCNAEFGPQPIPQCTGGDCIDCLPICTQFHGRCQDCLLHGCHWCPGDGICFNSNQYQTAQQGSCRVANSNDWLNIVDNPEDANVDDLCMPSTQAFQDPLYQAQEWVYALIHVRPVWEDLGITGQGVRVRINDDGVDAFHVELQEGFVVQDSCLQYLPPSTQFTHGTQVASVLGGTGDNGACAVGIAPQVSLSACELAAGNGFIDIGDGSFLTVQQDKHDISQNSWGQIACIPSNRKRQRNLMALDECPFAYDQTPFDFPCDVCGDFSNAANDVQCRQAIATHCRFFTEQEQEAGGTGCVDFLEFFLIGGECQYNVIPANARNAMIQGITTGRQGKGIIYVFSAGNDARTAVDVNMQGFQNARYTITVGAVGKDGLHSSYSNGGAALFVSAPGGDGEFLSNMVAATTGGGCTTETIGTSFAAPVVAGVIALMLQANPNLSWRDVQGILASTSTPVPQDSTDTSQVVNAAGVWHSNDYGFGIVNASSAVQAAFSWVLLPAEEQMVLESGTLNLPLANDASQPLVTSLVVPRGPDNFVAESVVVLLGLDHASRGDLQIVLTSPSGTPSVLHPGNRPETTNNPFEYWKLMTVRNWGESAIGEWTLTITDLDENTGNGANDDRLVEWTMIVYGVTRPYDSQFPSLVPTGAPTEVPSASPSRSPTKVPSSSPTNRPTPLASNAPTHLPTGSPTSVPTKPPSAAPSMAPTTTPQPSTDAPSNIPSDGPSLAPSMAPRPTSQPTISPTNPEGLSNAGTTDPPAMQEEQAPSPTGPPNPFFRPTPSGAFSTNRRQQSFGLVLLAAVSVAWSC